MPPVLTRQQGSLVVLFCGLMFSFGPLAFRALREADAWQFLFHRSWATAVVSAAIIVAAGRNPLRSVVEAGLRQVAAGLVVAGLFTLFIVALSRASAAFVLLMQSTSPFYAALFGRIFLKEPVGRDTLMAMVVAAVGVVVMVGGNVGSGDALGTLLS
ncbi:MAG: DMT family transporter, partial [Actinomycetota bacterium]|nr:DMT family transporter [Actinomycetota bacterium]